IARPGLVARLTRTGNGVEAPRALSRLRVVGIDEAADAELAPGHADNDFILYDDRGDGRGVTHRIVLHRHVPHDRPGAHVKCDEMRVERDHVAFVAEHAETALAKTAAARPVRRE